MTLNVELYEYPGIAGDKLYVECVQITEKISYRCLAQWMGDALTDYLGHNGNFISGTILTRGFIHIDIHLGGWILKSLMVNKFFYAGSNLPSYYVHRGLSRVIRVEDEPKAELRNLWGWMHFD
jgi:hypothetical protein